MWSALLIHFGILPLNVAFVHHSIHLIHLEDASRFVLQVRVSKETTIVTAIMDTILLVILKGTVLYALLFVLHAAPTRDA